MQANVPGLLCKQAIPYKQYMQKLENQWHLQRDVALQPNLQEITRQITRNTPVIRNCHTVFSLLCYAVQGYLAMYLPMEFQNACKLFNDFTHLPFAGPRGVFC